jgi:hypothetical protein
VGRGQSTRSATSMTSSAQRVDFVERRSKVLSWPGIATRGGDMTRVAAVVFDWAGTVVDFGNHALIEPAAPLDGFAWSGVSAVAFSPAPASAP